jgi:hypothetical protein
MELRRLSRAELLSLVEERADAVRRYLLWARDHDKESGSFRMSERPDIREAGEAAEAFAELWWGVIVYTCFGAKLGAETVAAQFKRPRAPYEAEAILADTFFPRGSIGHHRIQPAHKGAKRALVAACADHELFRDVLHSGEDFDRRYRRIRGARMRQWGRTTSFDLLLRTGALGVGGQSYKPEFAYLGGSTGPKTGFQSVWGVRPDDDATVAWAEALLRAWTDHWDEVADLSGVEWTRPPLEPCDQENFLCIYQERH